jgi:hypothetical protein
MKVFEPKSTKIPFQSIKHTSELHKYDEFMCIMYEAITREKARRRRYVNTKAGASERRMSRQIL